MARSQCDGQRARKRLQDAPHQVVDVNAADQQAELVLPPAREVDGRADDPEGEEERSGREEHPLAAVIAEVPAVQRDEAGELEQ